MQDRSRDKRSEEIVKRDPEFWPHLAALGLNSPEDYLRWCAGHGLSQRLDKSWRERCRERFLHKCGLIQERLHSAKCEKRRPQQFLDRLFSGALDEAGRKRAPLLCQLVESIASTEVNASASTWTYAASRL